MRNMHAQLRDIPVEKTVLGSNIIEIIDGHDKEAMLMKGEGGKTAYRYLSEAQKDKVNDEIEKLKPFDYDREKIEYYDKIRGVFIGLTMEKIERFLERNRTNFKRNSPHREVKNTSIDDI